MQFATLRLGNCVFVLLTGLGHAHACSVGHVDVNAVDERTYAGKAHGVTIHFVSERSTGNVTAFPEPPVTVTRGNRRCEIRDGGVWARNGVYLSTDGRFAVLNEYSGAADTLVAYRTDSCKRVGVTDVSGKIWRLQGNRLSILAQCTGKAAQHCQKQTHYDLDQLCTVKALRRG